MKNLFICLVIFVVSCNLALGQEELSLDKTAQKKINTYCNPIDIDYSYMVYNSSKNQSYRSGADPAVIEFRGEYYMFVTRSFGYWHSTDLINWNFIKPQQWFFEGCNAPTAFN